MSSFVGALASGIVVLDGGFATELESHGHDLRDSLWSARLLRDDPAAIVATHRAYFDAGAEVAITASYHASYGGFARAGFDEAETTVLLARSVALARQAQPSDRVTFVAGSVGLFGVVWANGTEYTGDYAEATDEMIATEQRARIAALAAAEPDLLAVETIPSGREAAILGELLTEVELPAWVTFCCRDGGHLSDGTPIEEAVRAVTRAGGPVAVGVNCTPPEHVASLLDRARPATDLPLVVYPNWGRVWNGDTYEWHGAGVDGFSPDLLNDWRGRGAVAIGGCCGIGPTAIADIAAWAAENRGA
jgi:S-methylmethionine-dependent homocysteine/selenocysteine methylase